MRIPKGFSPPAQGWRFSANPGERQKQEIQPRRGCVSDCQAIFKTDTTLFRVANLISFVPGLAEKRQPWAGGRNPFGIHKARYHDEFFALVGAAD